MFKKVLIIFCSSILVFFLTFTSGCGKKAEETPKTEQQETMTPPADTSMTDTTAMDTSQMNNM
jgi:hypothetical protein